MQLSDDIQLRSPVDQDHHRQSPADALVTLLQYGD